MKWHKHRITKKIGRMLTIEIMKDIRGKWYKWCSVFTEHCSVGATDPFFIFFIANFWYLVTIEREVYISIFNWIKIFFSSIYIMMVLWMSLPTLLLLFLFLVLALVSKLMLWFSSFMFPASVKIYIFTNRLGFRLC